MITDLDFADDIGLVSDTAEKGRKLLLAVERECRKVGLQLNAKKTKVMAFNTDDAAVSTKDGTVLEVVDDFKYLGAYIGSTEKELKLRRALAWSALHSMKKVWRSNLSDNLKRRLFVATVESILLYGTEAWTLTA
ncbi:reverse transcriptase domain-containing protein, partial [Acinetobacter baumannii]|uniref:reverse transcriptase domain-containing protein n=1 Tax=Acinetobacter baumannii TaxID=470 RepID=UPI0011788400